MRDLVVVVADADMQAVVDQLLKTPAKLAIHAVIHQTIRHPNRDAGCWNQAPKFLELYQQDHRHALVVFDHHGSGQDRRPVDELQADLEQRLTASGWQNRARAIIIQPELEAWVWSDSPQVEQVLGWSNRQPGLREWLVREKLLQAGDYKPADPKAAFERALRHINRKPSPAIFKELAAKVSIHRCVDPSFARLRETLQAWFPLTPDAHPNPDGDAS